jgi:hypothetical protein
MTGRIIGWALRRIHWKTFAAGAAAATMGGSVARPVLVSLVKAGMSASQMAAEAIEQARIETARIQAEAAASQRAVGAPSADLQAEVQQLRSELASVKAQLAGSAGG